MKFIEKKIFSGGGCYFGLVIVVDIFGRLRRMDFLRVVDEVLVMISEGICVYLIIVFIYCWFEVLEEFLSIVILKKSKILVIIEDYFLFVEKEG